MEAKGWRSGKMGSGRVWGGAEGKEIQDVSGEFVEMSLGLM